MKKRTGALISAGAASAAVVVVSAFLFSGLGAHRSPAGLVESDPNIAALRAIPLVKNIENPAPGEADDTNELIELFDSFADRNRNPDGSLNRGTHAKGRCFRGQLEVLPAAALAEQYKTAPDLARRLKQGLWSHDGQWPAIVRFANANGMGKIQADQEPDVRGFSFSVAGPPDLGSFRKDGRQDFMMNSTPGFASGGIHEFLEVVKAADTLIYRDFSHLPSPSYLLAVTRDLKLIEQGNAEGANLKSYAHLNYWANLPYTHGVAPSGLPADIVKYKATPCDGNGKVSLSPGEAAKGGENYLQEEIVSEARGGGICMLIQVQFLDPVAIQKSASRDQKNWGVSDWVENGGLLWNEADMPFFTVGKVTVPAAPGGESPEIACEDQYINTRLNSNPQNQPVGSIARVRTLIEENSRARRMGK